MRLSANGVAMLETARAQILAALEADGPLTVSELPRHWPVTRPLVRYLVDLMMEDGDVELAEGTVVPGRPDLRITPRGRARLRGLSEAAD